MSIPDVYSSGVCTHPTVLFKWLNAGVSAVAALKGVINAVRGAGEDSAQGQVKVLGGGVAVTGAALGVAGETAAGSFVYSGYWLYVGAAIDKAGELLGKVDAGQATRNLGTLLKASERSDTWRAERGQLEGRYAGSAKHPFSYGWFTKYDPTLFEDLRQ